LRGNAHLDPDFLNLTYGDEGRRGKPLHDLDEGDILAFYAGLKCTEQDKLVYALIGFFVIEECKDAEKIPKAKWNLNAHTRREFKDDDIVVFAKPGVSGRLERCIPIGEYRNKAYRVKKSIMEEWGGIKVRDGYIQRSGNLPQLSDPEKFCKWFKNQDVKLLRKNN